MATSKTDLNPEGVSHAGIQSHDWNAPVHVTGEHMGRIRSVTSGTVNVEPRPSAKRQASWSGPECPNPECGGNHTPVRTSGRDIEDRPLRDRVCADCGSSFTTIEQVVLFAGGADAGKPVPFALVDVEHRRRKREAKRRRYGWQAGGQMLRTREVRISGQPRVNGRSAR